ncbi:MAG TPA: IclR family transcriptional regulator C-terminal domain-containing protein [Acidimicrobiales bacterium]|nr:IclR family transcriptional regulator C-terminal domain-containing protein [Acidimicrobiales bacterium]
MPEDQRPDFVEALARGLAIITAFSATATALSVSDAAARASLPRPTARRLLMTLEQLGYVRSCQGMYTLTTKVLELGTAYIATLGIWELARPHLEALVARTGESSSMSQLDGSDIVYVARVPVPKIIALAVHIGTRFPAVATSMGQVLLADLPRDELSAVLETPSQSGIIPRISPSRRSLDRELAQVRKRGWAISDERLSLGIRSVAAPIRDASGATVAALNVTVHAAETPVAELTSRHLPLLLATAEDITREWVNLARLPVPDPLAPT